MERATNRPGTIWPALSLRAARATLLLLVALAVLAFAACGGDEEPAASTGLDETISDEPVEPTAFELALALLPNVESVHQQILFGDLVRLREAYPTSAEFRDALVGVWPADSIAGATAPSWGRNYGFRLGAVDLFVAGGFHPVELAILEGRFQPSRMRKALKANGYKRAQGFLSRGEDGSVDEGSKPGRLALSSLNRLRLTKSRIVAGSSTELVSGAAAPTATLAEDAEVVAIARALGPVTSAIVLPAGLVRPATGVLVTPLANTPALRVGVGIDDTGPDARTLSIALLYGTPAEADAEVAALEPFGVTEVPSLDGTAFGDSVSGISVSVVEDRVVLIRGEIVPGESPGVWRGWLETGDLAVLVRQR